MHSLKQLILNCDARLGSLLNIKHTAYTAENILVQGQGAYSQEEWTKARKAGYNRAGLNAKELDSEASFLRRAFGIEQRKLQTGLRLVPHLLLSGYHAVLEVGCGEMVTSWVIKSCLPGLRYCATDYDDFVIQKCRKLPLLNSLEKLTLDIDAISVDLLREFQLIVAWDVFYAFETARLSLFLDKIKIARTNLMICSSQITGPLRTLSYLLKSGLRGYAAKCITGRFRAHGFKCSLRYYYELAKRSGLDYELVASPPLDSPAGDSYYFIKISSRISVQNDGVLQPTFL